MAARAWRREHGGESMAARAWRREHGGESMVAESMVGESMAARAMARLGNPMKNPWQTCEPDDVSPNPSLPLDISTSRHRGWIGPTSPSLPVQIWRVPGAGKVNGFDSVGQVDSTPCQAGSTCLSGSWQVDATRLSLGIWVRESM